MKHKLNMADAVTLSRILFAVCLLLCNTFSIPFFVFYLLGGFSDMADGLLARKRNLSSTFGARLDTIADFVFAVIVLIKVLPCLSVPTWLLVWIGVIAFIKLVNLVSGFVMFRQMVPMHTAMNKVTGMLLFLLPFGIGCGSGQARLIAVVAVCAVATFAAIQEGHYIRTGKTIA